MRPTVAWALLAALAACATPYQPASIPLPMPPDAATEQRILAVFLRLFPRPESLAMAPLRVRSTWTDGGMVGETPVQNQAFLAVTPAGPGVAVEVVVQQQVLRSEPFALPAWHAAGANRALEERLVRELELELGLVER